MGRLILFRAALSLWACAVAAAAPAQPLAPEQERGLAAAGSFTECDECPQMIVLPAGSFTMGSPDSESGRNTWEGPQHTVSFARPFAVGKVEVTVDQFAAFVRQSGYQAGTSCWTFEKQKFDSRPERSWRNPGFVQAGSHPAACLSWQDAFAYVEWLAKKTGKPYRLLSEAEWEYAARATTTTGSRPRYGLGDSDDGICSYANGFDQFARENIAGTSSWPALHCSDGQAYTGPVGLLSANAFGLHDMLGNVKEWTQDCFHDNQGYRGAPADGSAWASGECPFRVVRGGSWLSYARLLRVAFRSKAFVEDRRNDTGMRVARTLLGP